MWSTPIFRFNTAIQGNDVLEVAPPKRQPNKD